MKIQCPHCDNGIISVVNGYEKDFYDCTHCKGTGEMILKLEKGLKVFLRNAAGGYVNPVPFQIDRLSDYGIEVQNCATKKITMMTYSEFNDRRRS
jgi:hypothetical protein